MTPVLYNQHRSIGFLSLIFIWTIPYAPTPQEIEEMLTRTEDLHSATLVPGSTSSDWQLELNLRQETYRLIPWDGNIFLSLE